LNDAARKRGVIGRPNRRAQLEEREEQPAAPVAEIGCELARLRRH
jgi:hypothetical protein